jgi:hypothetical protein
MSVTDSPVSLSKAVGENTEQVLAANDLDSEVELTCSLPAEHMVVDWNAVTFVASAEFTGGDSASRNRHIRLINQHALESVDDVKRVWDETEATKRDVHSVWVTTSGDVVEYEHPLAEQADMDAETVRLPSGVQVFERVPFEQSASSVAELETAVESVVEGFTEGSVSVSLR